MTLGNIGLVLGAVAQVMVSIAGVNTDNPDLLTLVALDSVAANTDLYLTDNEWDGSTMSFTSGEGYRKLTVQSTGWQPGKVVELDLSNLTTSDSSTLSHVYGSLSLSTTEEGVYLYQANSYTTPTSFVDAVKLGAGWTSNELLGTGLQDGEEALSFSADNVDYTGVTQGTRGVLLASLEDEQNYTASNSIISLNTTDWDVINCTPTNVTNLEATIGDGSMDLSWTAATCASSYLVAVYTSSISSSPSGAASSYSVNSQSYTDGSNPSLAGSEKVVYVNNSTSLTVTGLTNGTTYYFKVFSYDPDPSDQWSSGVEVSASPQVTGIDFTAIDQLYTIDFDNSVTNFLTGVFDASGISNGSSTGKLNSVSLSITGSSAGDIQFFDDNTNSSIWRGTSTGGVSNGGIYAFDVSNGGTLNTGLGFQMDDDDFTPGEVILRVKNSTGSSVDKFWMTYLAHTYNDKNNSVSVALSYSTDGTNYTSVANSDLSSAETADVSPSWSSRIAFVSLSGSPLLSANDYLYLKWTLSAASGSGEMDEVAVSRVDMVMHTTASATTSSISSEVATGTYENITVGNGRTVVIPTGNNVVVNGRVKCLGSFEIEKNATLVQTSTTDENDFLSATSVKVTCESPTIPSDVYFTYWSSPIDGVTMGSAFTSSNTSDFYYYDPTQDIDPDNSWVSATGSTTMTKGRGYITTAPIGISNASYTTEFSGTSLNNGDVTASVGYFGTPNDGDNDWNLLGNPYPSDIDWELFDGESSNDELGSTVYRWNQSSETIAASDYNSYTTTTGGTGGATKYIAPGQGFMTWCSTTGDGSVTFKNAHRVDGFNSTFYKGGPQVGDQRLWVSARNTSFYSQSLIAFLSGASDSFDDYDAPRLRGNGTVSLSVAEDAYSLAAYASPNMSWGETRIVRLAVDVLVADSIVMKLDSVQHVGAMSVLLFDAYLGVWTNLLEADYRFYVDAPGLLEDRFTLHFKDERDDLLSSSQLHDLVSGVSESSEDIGWRSWSARGMLYVRSDDERVELLELYNLSGQRQQSFHLTGDFGAFDVSGLRPGIYLLRAKSSAYTQRIFIQ